MFRKRFFIGLAVFLCLEAFSYADEVHYYQENGVTYRETRRYVTRPVVETKTQQTTRTVYKEEAYTENRDVAKTTWVPVTSLCAANLLGRLLQSFHGAVFRDGNGAAGLLATTYRDGEDAGRLP